MLIEMPFNRPNHATRRNIRSLFGRKRGLAARLSRSLAYQRLRIMRLGGSPHAVAVGLAAGVFVAWTPFLGFHILLAIPLAWMLGGSALAAAIGTAFANPLTLPLIWPLTWEIGQLLLGGERPAGNIDFAALFAHLDFSQFWGPVLKPMLLGSLPPGLTFALIFYVVTYLGVRGFRNRRLSRLTERARVIKSGKIGLSE